MSYFLVKTNELDVDPESLTEKMIAREKDFSTGFGSGIAVPHAVLTDEELHGNKIKGLLAVTTPPIDFESPDEEPVEIIVMLATPQSQRDVHLEVLSALAKMLRDETIRNSILNARSSADIYEIIHSEEAENFNYFLK